MRIKYRFDEGKLNLFFIGELDEHYAKGVKEYIDGIIDKADYIQSVVFDMSELKFMDSSGIGMLLGRYKKLKKLEIPCYIDTPTPTVEKVLELSGIYEVIPKL